METSGNRFFVSNISDIDMNELAAKALPSLPEQCQNGIHMMVFDPEEGERESILAYVPGESINGVHVSTLKSRKGPGMVLELMWLGSGVDVYLLFSLMNAVKKMYPDARITGCDADGNCSDEEAEISDTARDEAFMQRLDLFATLISTDVPFVNLDTIRGPKRFDLEEFRSRTSGKSLEEQVVQFLYDLTDDLWYRDETKADA